MPGVATQGGDDDNHEEGGEGRHLPSGGHPVPHQGHLPV